MPTATGKVTRAEMAQLSALVRAQAAIRSQLSETAERAVVRAFAAVPSYWDDQATAQAARTAARAVQVSQRRMAQVTDAYMARSTSIVTGRRVAPVGAVDVRSLRRQLPSEVVETLAHAPTSEQGAGPKLSARQQAVLERNRGRVSSVDAEEVYGRIAKAVRYQAVAGGLSYEQAVQRGLERARVMADTDVMLADRAQTNRFLTERKPTGVRGYRRVLRPEIDAGGGAGQPPCGLCVVAADRVYYIEDLMPIHARCRCGVMAVGEADDPGFRLNEEDLGRIYKQAGGTTAGEALKQIRVEVVEHGEFGPWLVRPQQRFRGPREVAKTQTTDQEMKTLAELEAAQDQLETLLARSVGGEDVERAIKNNRQRIRALNARLQAA